MIKCTEVVMGSNGQLLSAIKSSKILVQGLPTLEGLELQDYLGIRFTLALYTEAQTRCNPSCPTDRKSEETDSQSLIRVLAWDMEE